MFRLSYDIRGGRGRDRMVIQFTTTCAITVPITTKVVSLKPLSWRGVLDATLCDKVSP
jgi:hypothetical protein